MSESSQDIQMGEASPIITQTTEQGETRALTGKRTINNVFAATYSNVPVYEAECGPLRIGVMRRQKDNWMNCTQILKVAGLDKANRTRILDNEITRGKHEKIQGGYGKFQGTWYVQPPSARLLLCSSPLMLSCSSVYCDLCIVYCGYTLRPTPSALTNILSLIYRGED
jgi:hypothetical protein